MTDFLQTVRERVVIYDGAMGTNIQKRNPTLDDYWGKENCSEVLVLSRPDIIRDIHADFLQRRLRRGRDQHLRRTRIVLGEFDLADRVARDQSRGGQAGREMPRINSLQKPARASLPARSGRPPSCHRSDTSRSMTWWRRYEEQALRADRRRRGRPADRDRARFAAGKDRHRWRA